jgi:hypothetical protein
LAISTTGLPLFLSQPRNGGRAVGDALARIDDQQHNIGEIERALGLRPHASGERCRRRLFEPGGVDNAEFEVGDAAVAFTAVAGHPRRVVDQRRAPPDEPVEQRRLADIRPAEYRDREAHCSFEAFNDRPTDWRRRSAR